MSLDTLQTAETPEGILLTLRPAGVVARFYAFVIDLLIRAVVGSVLIGTISGLGEAMIGVALISLFLLEWFYPVVFELGEHQATPGKRVMGLRVVMDSGLPVTPASSLLRNLMRAVDVLPFGYAFGFVSMLLRADFKRLGDVVAGTRVVYHSHADSHGKVPDASPQAPARPLDALAQTAIVAWAARIPRLTPARVEELAQRAASVIPNAAAGGPATPGLLAVAQWLLGKR
jgi:uncharacterized RDD family membrane protein YckC